MLTMFMLSKLHEETLERSGFIKCSKQECNDNSSGRERELLHFLKSDIVCLIGWEW